MQLQIVVATLFSLAAALPQSNGAVPFNGAVPVPSGGGLEARNACDPATQPYVCDGPNVYQCNASGQLVGSGWWCPGGWCSIRPDSAFECLYSAK